MKGEKIMKEFVGLISKTYSYLKDNNDENKIKKVQKSTSKGLQGTSRCFKIMKTL